MDNTLEQLALYITQQLSQGVSERQLREALAQSGWTANAINGAFGIAQFHASHPQLPQPMSPTQQATIGVFPGDGVRVNPADGNAMQQTAVRQPRKRWLVPIVIVLVVLAIAVAIAGGVYLLTNQHQTQSKHRSATTSQTASQKLKTKPADPDTARRSDLNILLAGLSDYYVAHKQYPTFTQLTSGAFDKQQGITASVFKDPAWTTADSACASHGTATLATAPTPHCYAYATTGDNGIACDDSAATCTEMTLTATLQNGKAYAITLDKNTVK